MQREIGETFDFKGDTFEITKGHGCNACAFEYDMSHRGCLAIGECSGDKRADGLSVVAVEI